MSRQTPEGSTLPRNSFGGVTERRTGYDREPDFFNGSSRVATMRGDAPRHTGDGRQIHVLLVDDHPAIRAGLALLLAQEEIVVCGQADARSQALLATERAVPHVALVDLSLGAEDGVELVAELDSRGVPVLIFSMYEDGEHVQEALTAGARGYVTKREMHRVLTDAIREVAAGRGYLSPRASSALAAHLHCTGQLPSQRDLSEREREVYHLLGEGATTSEVASSMHVSVRTVESYCARLMEKLGVDGMRRLRRDAIRNWHDGSE